MRRRERLNKIFDVVATVDENETKKNEMVKKIFQKWPDKLDIYKYIDNDDEFVVGDYVYYVDLNLTKIAGGIIVKLEKDCIGIINLVVLKNTSGNYVWKIRPSQKYFFRLPNPGNRKFGCRGNDKLLSLINK